MLFSLIWSFYPLFKTLKTNKQTKKTHHISSHCLSTCITDFKEPLCHKSQGAELSRELSKSPGKSLPVPSRLVGTVRRLGWQSSWQFFLSSPKMLCNIPASGTWLRTEREKNQYLLTALSGRQCPCPLGTQALLSPGLHLPAPQHLLTISQNEPQ